MVFRWTGRILCLALALAICGSFARGWPVWASETESAHALAPAAKAVDDYVYFAGANDFQNPEVRTFERSVPKTLQEFTEAERARRSFLEAQKLFSGSPSLDLLVALSYWRDANHCVLQTEKGLQKADIIGLSSIEWTIRGLLMLRSGGLQVLSRFDESKIVVDRLLKIDPFDERMLKRQSINYFVLDKFGSSLDATYRSNGFRGLSFNALTDLDSDPEFVKRAMAEISKSPSLRYRLNAHAQYCMQMADSAKNQEAASKLYELAQNDYIASLEIDDKYKLDTVICCFDLSLKLIDFVAAKKYYKLALRLDKEAIPTKIAEVKFREAIGDREAARALYRKISNLVDNAKYDQPDSTTFTFQFLEPEVIQRIDAQFLKL